MSGIFLPGLGEFQIKPVGSWKHRSPSCIQGTQAESSGSHFEKGISGSGELVPWRAQVWSTSETQPGPEGG